MAIKIFCSIFCVILQCFSLRGGDESAAACVGAAHCHALLLAMESLDNLANLDNMDISVKVPPPLHSIFHEQAKSIVAIRVSSCKCYCQGGYDGRGKRSCKYNYVDFYKDARPPC